MIKFVMKIKTKEEEIEIDEQDFSIDPSCIDTELCAIARKMMFYGSLESSLKVDMESLSTSVEELEGMLSTHYRDEIQGSGVRATQQLITSKVKVDPTYKKMIEQLHEVERNYLLARAATRAIQAKKDCLIAFTYRDKEMMKVDRFSS